MDRLTNKERAEQIIRNGQETPNEDGYGHAASLFRTGEDEWMVCQRDTAPGANDPRITTEELKEIWTEDVAMVIEDPEGGDNEVGGDDPELDSEIEEARIHTQYG